MENLNAEQIKKALEHCIKDSTCEQCPQSPFTCHIQEDALALINSQEQRIEELTEENERLMRDKTALECVVSTARNQAKYDTVRKMRAMLKNAFPSIAEAIDYFANELLNGEGMCNEK